MQCTGAVHGEVAGFAGKRRLEMRRGGGAYPRRFHECFAASQVTALEGVNYRLLVPYTASPVISRAPLPD
jgi:hypothetical protein